MVRVQDAKPGDAEAILSVTAEGWRTGYREIVSPEHLADLPVDRWGHEIRVGLRRPAGDSFTFVAGIGGAFAGYCYVAAPSRDADLGGAAAEVVALYVDPRRWGQGAGAALMTAALARLAGLGYAEAVLWTFKENARAVAFYRRHGWVRDGSEKLHARTDAVAVRYRRLIDRPAGTPQ